MRQTVLYPNFAAEEDSSWKVIFRLPIQRRIAKLWRALFDENARFVDQRLDEDYLRSAPILRCDRPPFPGASVRSGLVPWLSTTEARDDAMIRNLTYCAPEPQVVRSLHDKSFAIDVARQLNLEPTSLRGLARALSSQELVEPERALQIISQVVSNWPKRFAQNFTMKPRFGSSGRGRVPGSINNLGSAELRGALKRLAERGGAILEPWLERRLDLSAQFNLSREGAVQSLGTLEQLNSVSGSYFGHRGVIDPNGGIRAGTTWDDDVSKAAIEVARIATARGYFGLCGVDAFSFVDRDPDGLPVEQLRSIVEFNARFTFGSIVLGLAYQLRAQYPHLFHANGRETHFAFLMAGEEMLRTAAPSTSADVHHLELFTPAGPLFLLSAERSALNNLIGR